MSSNINPVFGTYKYTGSFRFWVQKVLPLVYDDSLSYYELLCKVVQYLNDVIANVDTLNGDVEALREAFMQLQEYVNNYFDNLDVQDEINNKLDQMAEDGILTQILWSKLPISVKFYGAKGDGVTDDTEAFQKAVNSGYDVFVPMAMGEHYIITDTILCNKPRQVIFSHAIDRVFDETVNLESGMGFIYSSASPVFNVTATGVRFQNLTIVTSNFSGGYNYIDTCIKFDAIENADNADGQVTDCAFYGYNHIIENYGRGLGFYRNACYRFNRAIYQVYTYDGAGGLDVQQPLYGDRALRIQDNRFHTGNMVLENYSGMLYGAIISNNVSDGGAGLIDSRNNALFETGMHSCSIIGNTCPICNRNQWIIIRGGKFYNNTIIGNTVSSLETAKNSYRLIQIENTVSDFSFNNIIGNTFKHCVQDCMLFSAKSVSNIINGNIIADCCVAESNSISPIRFNNGLDDTIISGNMLYTIDNSISRGMVQILNNPTISGNRIINNNTNLSTYVYGNYTQGSKPNDFQTS